MTGSLAPLLAPQHGDLPHAEPSPVTRPFWDGCAAGELRFQRCRGCRAAQFPPAEICRACLATDLAWERSAGSFRHQEDSQITDINLMKFR